MAQTTTVKPVAFLATKERQLITIEFAPNIHRDETEYSYEHPQFVFGDRVTIGGTSFHYPPVVFTVCALELIESKTPSGKLLNQPYWKYKVTNGQESYWKDETALIRYDEHSLDTCSTCFHFNNYNEANGKGWCNQFNQPARTHHKKTNDCFYFSQTIEEESELDKPYSLYQVGSIVKVIDENEDHEQWAVFEIVECKHNPKL